MVYSNIPLLDRGYHIIVWCNGMRYSTYLPIIVIVFILSSVYVAYSAYREVYDLRYTGSLYVLDLNITLEEINNYGVVSMYLRPHGVYAYGVSILKDPDEDKPHLYLMIGPQDKWYDLGLIGYNLSLRIVFDLNSSKAVVYYNGQILRYKLSSIRGVNKLYIASFNITGRMYEYPRISLNRVVVWSANYTLNDTLIEKIGSTANLSNIGFRESLFIGGEETVIKTSISTSTTPYNPPSKGWSGVNWIAISATAIAAVVFLITLYIYSRGRQVPRSVNQSYP